MATITTITNEPKRGCGYRKAGGMYVVSGGLGKACGKLPIILDVCPCCGGGIKPSLGWTWINPSLLVEAGKCKPKGCKGCVLAKPPEKAGLLWIGETYYKSPEEFTAEAIKAGVSRRISSIPRNFELGKTWVFVAHRKLSTKTVDGKEEDVGGIFHVFKPERIEYIIKGDETEEDLDRMEKRGITLIKLVRTDGADNPMVWHRRKVDGGDTTLYECDGYEYKIASLENGTKFVLSYNGTSEELGSYKKAKERAEQLEAQKRKAAAAEELTK